MKRGGQKQTGFTIVELLIVVVVIAILAAITIVAYNGIRDRANASAVSAELQQAAKTLEAYSVVNSGAYPTTLAAAQQAGVKISSNLTPTYYSNGLSYCMELEGFGSNYVISNFRPDMREGVCSPSGLLSWIPLNGNAQDVVVSGNNAVITDAVPTIGQGGRASGAYAFSGVTARIDSAFQYPTTNGQPFTVSVWSKGTPEQANEWGYVARRGTGNDVGSSVWIIAINTDNQYVLAVNGAWGTSQTGIFANDTDWRHLVITYDGQTQRSYVDGVERIAQEIGPITRTLGGGALVLGTINASRPLDGAIDDFRLFNRVLSAQEVADLYETGAR